MNAANRVIKNTGILYARMGITVFISLYSTRLILGALGVEDFGIFNVVAGAIAMLTFFNNAMTGATQRFISFAEGAGDKDKVKIIFNVSVVLHYIIAALVLIVLEVTGYVLFNNVLHISTERLETAKLVYQFMVVSTLFTIISVPYDAVINAHENMLMVAVLGTIEALLKLFVAIYITYSAYDKLLMYGLLTAGIAIALLLIRRIYCSRKYKECSINLKQSFRRNVFTDMAKFAGWNLLGATTSMLSFYGQGPLLNSFFGTTVNAAQGIANQVNGQLSAFANTMLKALSPVLGKSEGAGDRELLKNATFLGSKMGFFLLALFYIPVIIEMPMIFSFWLKEVPPYTIIFCRLLLARSLFEQLSYVLNMTIAANGNISKYEKTGAVVLMSPIIFSYLTLSNGYPPESLYAIFLVFSVVLLGHRIYFLNRNIGFSTAHYISQVLLPSSLIFIIAFLIAYIPVLIFSSSTMRIILVLFLSTTFLILGAIMNISKSHPEFIGRLLNKVNPIFTRIVR